MGLIDGAFGRAVAAGIGGAAAGGAAITGLQIKMQMEEEKAKAIARHASDLHRGDVEWGENLKDQNHTNRIVNFKKRESELNNSAAEAGPINDETQKRMRRQAGFEAGLINMRDVETAETQESRNKIMDERYDSEAADRKSRSDREERRLSAAEGKSAKSEQQTEKVRTLQRKFLNSQAQGAGKQMLDMIDADIVANGGKSMFAKDAGSFDFSVVDSEEGKGVVIGNKKTGEADFRTPQQMKKGDIEIRYKGTEAYKKGTDGRPVRAPEYDKK